MIRKIKGAKVTKGRTLCPSFLEILDDKTERLHENIKCDQLVHDDLLKAFDKLKSHLVIICDLREGDGLDPENFNPEDQLVKFKVTGFSIGGEDDHEGVTLTGQKELKGGKILNLNSPFTKYMDENDGYAFGHVLAADIQACIYEIEQYMFNGKYAIKQLEIPFETKDPDSPEFQQQANETADAVLEKLGDSIITDSKKSKGKGSKKGKVVEMLSTDQVEVTTAEAF